MRDNTKTLRALPQFSTFETKRDQTYARLSFPSIREMHDCVRANARTENEHSWKFDPHWLGLENQSVEDFDKTGIAAHPLKLLQAAQAKLPKQHTRLAQPHAAMTGGYWDTPSVLAGLPLAARTRKRSKLPPKDIKLAFFVSGGVSAESMAMLTAKLSKAIYDYTIEGGAVNLSVAICGTPTGRDTYAGHCVESKVNTTDTATLALALSPVNVRSLGFALIAGMSENVNHIICPTECPLPNYLWCGGVLTDMLRTTNAVIQSLQITE